MKLNKQIIGYLPGTFDLFHIGHLNIIRKAKEHCDYLIVGINTDETCCKMKNKIPIVPFEERCQIVEAIPIFAKVTNTEITFLKNQAEIENSGDLLNLKNRKEVKVRRCGKSKIICI